MGKLVNARNRFGRLGGECLRCGHVVGNLAVHEPKCKREQAEFYSDEDWMAVERAGAHSAPDSELSPSRRLRNKVTDLDVARLLLAMERGVVVRQGGPQRWFIEKPHPLATAGKLTRTVDEMVLLGLATGVSTMLMPQLVSVVLKAAPVHLRSSEDRWKPKCDAQALRYRIVDHPDLADCANCKAY